MKRIKRILFISMLIFASFQTKMYADSPIDKILLSQLSYKFDTLSQNQPDSVKLKINNECINILSKLLSDPSSFENQLEELKFIGKVYSDDGEVKIYTWGFPLQDKSFAYGGFIQKKEKKKVTTTRLTIRNSPYIPLQNKNISAANWYGALYYKVMKIKKRREEYYVALGWSGNDGATDFKVIEPIYFDRNGKVTYLGKPLFEEGKKLHSRIVLEYTSEGKVALSFNETNDLISFDHLVPIEPMYKGIRAYYGPDFTYDAYRLQKDGKWSFEENIDARNKQ